MGLYLVPIAKMAFKPRETVLSVSLRSRRFVFLTYTRRENHFQEGFQDVKDNIGTCWTKQPGAGNAEVEKTR